MSKNTQLRDIAKLAVVHNSLVCIAYSCVD